jgi:hypothetical protein
MCSCSQQHDLVHSWRTTTCSALHLIPLLPAVLAWVCCAVLQVVDKSSDAVLDEIEAAIYQVASSIMAGNGFAYDIPSRAKGNQLYVPELDRIVLKDSISKRPFASTQQCR